MRVLGLLAVAAAALLAAQAATPLVHAQVALAADDDGTLVKIGPDRAEVTIDTQEDARAPRQRFFRGERRLGRPGFAEAPVAVSRFWIGLGGTPLPAEFRAQLDIEPDEGVLIRTVAPDGPAAKAGVERFDILLRANGEAINDIRELSDEVGEQGEMKGRITLDLLRKGQPKTVWVTPEERPLDATIPAPPRRERIGRLFGPDGVVTQGGIEGLLNEQNLNGLFNGEGMPFGEEGLGGFAEMIPQMAGAGVSVSVRRQNDGPAKVTVQRGDQTWEFDEGDQAAMEALPADVRPMVTRMLGNNRVLGEPFEGFGVDGPGFQLQFGDDMAERVRAMQERMRAMQGRLGAAPRGGANADPGAVAPQIELGEAPTFDSNSTEPQPEEAGPIELEIPAVE